MAKVIGFSGSAVRSGTVEKALEHVLKSTGHEWELIQLNSLDMKQCIGCTKCAGTYRCILKDDINGILDKVVEADAIVVGSPARVGGMTGLTKTFLERLFPLYHRDMLTRGKVAATVAGGMFHNNSVENELSQFYSGFGMVEAGSMIVGGNASCYKCGYGETCDHSAFIALYGEGAKITDGVFYSFEKDEEAKGRAELLGKQIADALNSK